MKVLHVSGARGWGGNEQQMMYVIPELENLGVNNIVFGLDNSLLQKQCLDKKIKFIGVKSRKLNKFSNYFILRKIVESEKPNLIHLHTSDSLTVFAISDLLFGLKTKTVFSKKGMGVSGSFLSKIKYNYKGVNCIFCVSNSVKRDFSKILSNKNKSKTKVIHDCVSLEILKEKPIFNCRNKFSISNESKIIGNIANHTAAKDIETLINTVDYLVNNLKRKDFVLIQLGEFSKLTSHYVNLIKRKNLEKFIIFTDKIDKAYTLNPQFDIFLMTSQREGGPTSVLEAMLLNVPIVSTDVGVISEVIVNNENGYISAVKDAKSLAVNINSLIDNQLLCDKFANISKLKVEKEFNAEYISHKTFLAYQETIVL
jgi:glycosyltransferase involved in cell wall biosynthesis